MKRLILCYEEIPTTTNNTSDLRDDVYLKVKSKITELLASLPDMLAAELPEYDANFSVPSDNNIEKLVDELASESTYRLLLDCPFRSEFY